MKLSMKVLSMTALIFAVSYSATAEQMVIETPGNPKLIAKQRTAELIRILYLDRRQAVAVERINFRHAKNLQSTRRNNYGNKKAMRRVVTAINRDKQRDMSRVLRPRQFAAYQQLEANRRANYYRGKRRIR